MQPECDDRGRRGQPKRDVITAGRLGLRSAVQTSGLADALNQLARNASQVNSSALLLAALRMSAFRGSNGRFDSFAKGSGRRGSTTHPFNLPEVMRSGSRVSGAQNWQTTGRALRATPGRSLRQRGRTNESAVGMGDRVGLLSTRAPVAENSSIHPTAAAYTVSSTLLLPASASHRVSTQYPLRRFDLCLYK